jgi:hypothetical protein
MWTDEYLDNQPNLHQSTLSKWEGKCLYEIHGQEFL